MNVLIACEFSGIVRQAFKSRGHNAWSCDLIDTEIPGQHLKGNVESFLVPEWDLMIGHPPCTYLAISGARWFASRQKEQQQAIQFFMKLWNAPIKKIALENPISILSSKFRKPDQVIHPWQFGQSFEKTTCLWLKNLPKLIPTKIVEKGEFYEWVRKNNTPTRNDLQAKIMRFPKWSADIPYGPNRGRERSRTFQGIANAMAEQWG